MRIEVNDLKVSYHQKVIISNLSFKLESGDFLTIYGKNGAGKSSLIKCILGLHPYSEGNILVDDIDIRSFKNWKNVGYVSQKFDNFSFEFPLTINELLYASNSKRLPDYELNKVLEKLSIFDIANEDINSLSGGQLQRVFIARALINKPKLLVLDEPTVGVDTVSTESFKDILKELSDEGTTIIMITHDQSECRDVYTHVLELNNNFSYTFQAKEDFFSEEGDLDG